MAHVEKFTRVSLGHMLKHYERKVDSKNYSNENIDTNKTHLNYNLAPEHDNNYEFIKQRCEELNCLKRKDVNVMCDWVVTMPKDLLSDYEQPFFENTYKFLEDRYGKENVVSSYVHKDEITPHMHFSFIPVVHDKKKKKDKVSAKERINRNDLRTFHKDLEKYLEQSMGFKVNILNEATRDGNKEIVDLKRETALKKIEQLQNMANSLSNDIKNTKVLTNALEEIKPKKSLIGNKMSLSEEEYCSLIALAKKGQSTILENRKLKAKVGTLERELNESKASIENLRKLSDDNYNLMCELKNVKQHNRRLNESFRTVERAVERIGKTDEVNKEIRNMQLQNQRNSFSRDR